MDLRILQALALLFTLITLNLHFATSSSPNPQYQQLDNTKGFFSSSNEEEHHPHKFSYEFETPQKILTGCSGTKDSSEETITEYYFVDASGVKKIIAPDQPAEVVFPSNTGLPGLTRIQKVYMYEMCFPTPCNVQGSCSPTGSTVGPTGWSLKCKTFVSFHHM